MIYRSVKIYKNSKIYRVYTTADPQKGSVYMVEQNNKHEARAALLPQDLFSALEGKELAPTVREITLPTIVEAQIPAEKLRTWLAFAQAASHNNEYDATAGFYVDPTPYNTLLLTFLEELFETLGLKDELASVMASANEEFNHNYNKAGRPDFLKEERESYVTQRDKDEEEV